MYVTVVVCVAHPAAAGLGEATAAYLLFFVGSWWERGDEGNETDSEGEREGENRRLFSLPSPAHVLLIQLFCGFQ